MTELHSKFSASGFEAATLCPGKRVMERGLPDPGSKYADEGTAAHLLLKWAVEGDKPAAAFKGRRIPVGLRTFEADDEMVGAVQTAIDNIRDIVGAGMLLSDQRVNYSGYLGVPTDDAWGTLDIGAARGTELQVHDYKHGRGVEVDAEDNAQMKLYALGLLAAVGDLLGPFETVRLVIHQPRLKDAPSEWTLTVAELEAWGYGAARSSVCTQLNAESVIAIVPADKGGDEWNSTFLRPNEKSCRFCRAKATCPALRNEVAATVFAHAPASPDEFDAPSTLTQHVKVADEKWLAAALFKVDLIEDWCKAVRAEVERRMLDGKVVPGFKLVQGKQGNRAWGDKTAAEAALKSFRLKVEEMYDLSLISPTTAEKLSKDKVIGPRQWKTLQDHITRADGKKHVAPVTDPRPALVLTPAEDDFDTVSTEPAIDFA